MEASTVESRNNCYSVVQINGTGMGDITVMFGGITHALLSHLISMSALFLSSFLVVGQLYILSFVSYFEEESEGCFGRNSSES
jgi:hypothetical protein